MTKFLLSATAAALFIMPAAASAQAIPTPVIAVVDVQRATSQCNACKAALTQLESQVTSLKSLETSLGTSLRNEANSIQTAITALGGKQPDAALAARAQAFEKKQGDAQRQLAAREQGFQRNRQYILQQIGAKLDPALTGVLARRGATMMIDAANVMRFAPALDVTNDVIAALNASLTTLSTTAPAQAAAPAPRGR